MMNLTRVKSLMVGWTVVVAVLASPVSAVDIKVLPKKLVVLDKLATAGKAKTVFVATGVDIEKGNPFFPSNNNVNDISATFHVAYDGAAGSFTMPEGAFAGSEGWKVNKPTVAKYVNKAAPDGSTAVKVAVLKPEKLVKVVAKGLGDGVPLDIFTEGAPEGNVYAALCVTNSSTLYCHCGLFNVNEVEKGCTFRSIAAGTGAKLVCKDRADGDFFCTAVP